MKIQPYIEKLKASKEFKEFTEKHTDAYLVAGFFVLDFETNHNLHQIDYYVPSQKKVAAFTIGDEILVQMMDTMNDKTPEKLDITTNVDLDALQGILEDEMKNRNMTEEIKKIIAVIQNIEGKKLWILNCVLSGMEILKAHVEDESRTVLKMERASVMDYIKKLPGAAAGGMQQQAAGQVAEEPTADEIEDKIEQLDRLKKELEKEKDRVEKEDDSKKHDAIEKEKNQ